MPWRPPLSRSFTFSGRYEESSSDERTYSNCFRWKLSRSSYLLISSLNYFSTMIRLLSTCGASWPWPGRKLIWLSLLRSLKLLGRGLLWFWFVFGEVSSWLSLLFLMTLCDLPLFFLVVRASTFWWRSTWTVRLRAYEMYCSRLLIFGSIPI